MSDSAELDNGVYLGLPEATYFGQPRLGSTDLSRLYRSPADWWYGSKWNPDRDEGEGSDERDFGAALHVLILEGEAAYESKVVIRPAQYPDAKTGELKPWHASAAYCKAWMAQNDRPDAIMLPEAWAMRVRHMAHLLLEHPQFRIPLRSGLPEVSVLFWLHDVPVRARIDYLLPQFVIDLKTFGGHVRGRDPQDRALRIIAERDYDVQRYVYDRARAALVALVQAGKVHGATAEQLSWLERVAAEPDWGWVWLFYQRRDDRAGRAPIVMPIHRRPNDITFDTGRRKVEAALRHYRDYQRRFGIAVPWADVRPMVTPLDHEFPSWLSDIPVEDDEEIAA